MFVIVFVFVFVFVFAYPGRNESGRCHRGASRIVASASGSGSGRGTTERASAVNAKHAIEIIKATTCEHGTMKCNNDGGVSEEEEDEEDDEEEEDVPRFACLSKENTSPS